MGDMNPDYFFVTYMMKTFKMELKYNNIAELWCSLREEGLEIGLSRLHSNKDVLWIIERLERAASNGIHVYVVHGKNVTNYFTPIEGSSKGVVEGSSKSVDEDIAEGTITVHDEASEDLGQGESGVGVGEGEGVGQGGVVMWWRMR
ncbi:hypothetical protein CJ030_MR5G010199 [Morella rubra]|uniref:PB1-like domain-containing protein n=1 Tax=Morella rubra TaxID=262757 RepID=A0A6A1VJ19_9ROSI|nr:hypothetical protein CJ030_MR5G010199 [Morella rubra]